MVPSRGISTSLTVNQTSAWSRLAHRLCTTVPDISFLLSFYLSFFMPSCPTWFFFTYSIHIPPASYVFPDFRKLTSFPFQPPSPLVPSHPLHQPPWQLKRKLATPLSTSQPRLLRHRPPLRLNLRLLLPETCPRFPPASQLMV